MLIGKIHPGSGLGDQLFSYIITRVIALDKGYDFGFVGKEFFKGKEFMSLDWGSAVDLANMITPNTGKLEIYEPHKLFVFDKPYYDPEVNFIQDGTVIDGYGAQSEFYWGHRLNEIREWLKVKEIDTSDDVCVLNIRGGEYMAVPELFLPHEYWDTAMDIMRSRYPNIKFVIHTDNANAITKMFPSLPIYQGIEKNWQSIRYAKHLILSNSAFAIIPALLNENVKEVIAPRWWAGHNVKEWRRPQNYYSRFLYV